MIPEAKLLKEASAAPIAIASVGSLQYGVERRRSSNTCRWNMAASASRAIWHKWGQDASSKKIPTPGTRRSKIREMGGKGRKDKNTETERDNIRGTEQQKLK